MEDSLFAVDLPAAAIARILTFLSSDPPAFAAASRVSRHWRACSSDQTLPFWRRLDAVSFAALSDRVPLCACLAARAVARFGHVLTHVNLSAAATCPACRAPPVQVSPPRSPPGGGQLLQLLFAACPLLEELDLSCAPAEPGDAALMWLPARRPLLGLFGGGLLEGILHAAHEVRLPRLRFLSLSHTYYAGVARGVGRVLAQAPALEEVHCTGVRGADALHELARARGLRLNLADAQRLPRAVDLACGLCGSLVVRGVTSFAKGPPSQRHLSEEWYVEAPPADADVAPLAGVALRLNCARNCHRPQGLYLIDAGTGAVDLHGWAYGVAVGPARDGRGPLAVVIPLP